MKSSRPVILASPVRIAIGTFSGSLKDVLATELGALKNAATRVHTDWTDRGHLGDEQMTAGWRWLCPTTH